MTNCVICGHEIRSMDDPKKTRQDTMSFYIHNKVVCGSCGDEMSRTWLYGRGEYGKEK